MARAISRRRGRQILFPWIYLLAATACAYPQASELNLNTYYRFPLSLGLEYQSLSPFAAYGSQFNTFELSAALRVPISTLPVLQPILKGGMIRFDNQDLAQPLKWDHTHWYGALGLDVAHRFARNFELGGEALVGLSEAIFPDLLPGEGPVGNLNLFFELGGRIALNPSYGISIDVHPNLKYLMSLGPLKDFDGFVLGIGFAASFRFGQDPDAPGAVIRSIRFDQASIPSLFAAMQSYYARHPAGKVTITNTEKQPIADVVVSFMQPGYMDSPTPAASLPELKAGEKREIELFASFNQEVFRTEGVTPLTGEVIVSYKSDGRAAEQRQSVSYDLQDRTAVTWDDDRKVAAFITPADGALRNYASFIRQLAKDLVIPTQNEPQQAAIQVFRGLTEIGILYQADPRLPFTQAQSNSLVVDSISLPRDTLKRITGDCDDLTVLYDSLLETVGIETGFITTPGHIYSAFNTKVASQEYRKIHPDRNMTISLDGELWVPVEITMIGKTGFLEAWRKGIEEWKEYEDQPEKRGFIVSRKAQELYRPVGLKEVDLGLQYGSKDRILAGVREDMDRLVEVSTENARRAARDNGTKQDYNTLGVQYGQFLRYAQAEEAFNRALKLDPRYDAASINLGNVLYLKRDYPGAMTRFQDTFREIERRGEASSANALKVLLNISKTYYQMARYPEAEQFYGKAQAIDREQAKKFAYLSEPRPDQARAAEGRDPSYEILFVEE